MYYNSNQNSNDYYSAYKEEIDNYQNGNISTFKKVLVPGLTILFLGLLTLGGVYLYNLYSNTSNKSYGKIATTNTDETNSSSTNTIALTEVNLPKSIQLNQSTPQPIKEAPTNIENSIKEHINSVTPSSNISPKDIELIVKIIMSQMNNAPKEQKVTLKQDTLEEELVAAESEAAKELTLKESNHYNKVILTQNESIKNAEDTLIKLQNSLDTVTDEHNQKEKSDYTQAIAKEVETRSDEMRVIVVQKGDTLSKIAKKAYGNYDDYVKIFRANPEIVKNPNQIFVGQRLRIPAQG